MSSAAVALRTVEVLLRELEAADEFSGVVGVTQGDQELLLEAFGFASRTWNIPVTIETRFDTASITKLFTAVATLQLIERGALALDTPVIEFLGLQETGISPAVTPYHLLTHTSGIADDADEEAGERYEDLFLKRPNYSVLETADYLPQFVGKPPNFAPGEGSRYCNVGYVLLGLMIERATGSSYRSYVAEHVFAPAGMNRSGFFRMDVVETDVAEGVEVIEDDDGCHRRVAAQHLLLPAGRWTRWRRACHRRRPLALPPSRDRRAPPRSRSDRRAPLTEGEA